MMKQGMKLYTSALAVSLLVLLQATQVTSAIPRRRLTKTKKSKKGSGKTTKKSKKGPPPPPPDCGHHPLIRAIEDHVLDAVAVIPQRCCHDDAVSAPYAAIVTHSQINNSTETGLESFWDGIFNDMDQTYAMMDNVCFVMTGYNQNIAERELSVILQNVLDVTSTNPMVASMMATDPTSTFDVVDKIRDIWKDDTRPWIGVFNAGYTNMIVESIRSGESRLPFIGYISDSEFGEEAAADTVKVLDGEAPQDVICFNHRQDLDFVNQRCEDYYNSLGFGSGNIGVACSAESTAQDLYNQIGATTNGIFAQVDCCSAAAEAVEMIRAEDPSRTIVLGCADKTDSALALLSSGSIAYIATPPNELESYTAATWTAYPTQSSESGGIPFNAKEPGTFPALGSLARMKIFTIEDALTQ